jgi:hypothetical protein
LLEKPLLLMLAAAAAAALLLLLPSPPPPPLIIQAKVQDGVALQPACSMGVHDGLQGWCAEDSAHG